MNGIFRKLTTKRLVLGGTSARCTQENRIKLSHQKHEISRWRRNKRDRQKTTRVMTKSGKVKMEEEFKMPRSELEAWTLFAYTRLSVKSRALYGHWYIVSETVSKVGYLVLSYTSVQTEEVIWRILSKACISFCADLHQIVYINLRVWKSLNITSITLPPKNNGRCVCVRARAQVYVRIKESGRGA